MSTDELEELITQACYHDDAERERIRLLHLRWLQETADHEAGHAVVAWVEWVAAGQPVCYTLPDGAPRAHPWTWATARGARELVEGIRLLPFRDVLGEVSNTDDWDQPEGVTDAIAVAGTVAEWLAAGEVQSDADAQEIAYSWVYEDFHATGDLAFTTWRGSSSLRSLIWPRRFRKNPQKRSSRARRATRAILRAQAILIEHRALWERVSKALIEAPSGIAWYAGGAALFEESATLDSSTVGCATTPSSTSQIPS